jgi:hypothetical protein
MRTAVATVLLAGTVLLTGCGRHDAADPPSSHTTTSVRTSVPAAEATPTTQPLDPSGIDADLAAIESAAAAVDADLSVAASAQAEPDEP